MSRKNSVYLRQLSVAIDNWRLKQSLNEQNEVQWKFNQIKLDSLFFQEWN